MKNTKITFGIISLIIGIILFILLVDLISKPSNITVAFDPIGIF